MLHHACCFSLLITDSFPDLGWARKGNWCYFRLNQWVSYSEATCSQTFELTPAPNQELGHLDFCFHGRTHHIGSGKMGKSMLLRVPSGFATPYGNRRGGGVADIHDIGQIYVASSCPVACLNSSLFPYHSLNLQHFPKAGLPSFCWKGGWCSNCWMFYGFKIIQVDTVWRNPQSFSLANFAIKAAPDYEKTECPPGWCFEALLNISSHFWYPKIGKARTLILTKLSNSLSRDMKTAKPAVPSRRDAKVLSSLALSPTLTLNGAYFAEAPVRCLNITLFRGIHSTSNTKKSPQEQNSRRVFVSLATCSVSLWHAA